MSSVVLSISIIALFIVSMSPHGIAAQTNCSNPPSAPFANCGMVDMYAVLGPSAGGEGHATISVSHVGYRNFLNLTQPLKKLFCASGYARPYWYCQVASSCTLPIDPECFPPRILAYDNCGFSGAQRFVFSLEAVNPRGSEICGWIDLPGMVQRDYTQFYGTMTGLYVVSENRFGYRNEARRLLGNVYAIEQSGLARHGTTVTYKFPHLEPNNPGFVIIGTRQAETPIANQLLLIDLTAPHIAGALGTQSGTATLDLALPNAPADYQFLLQCGFLDSRMPNGWGMSSGVRVSVRR